MPAVRAVLQSPHPRHREHIGIDVRADHQLSALGARARQFCSGVDRQAGRRVVAFEAQAWQDDPSRPIASAFGHFMLRRTRVPMRNSLVTWITEAGKRAA
jgi:hypothetical protein